MAKPDRIIRQLVYDAILARKRAGGFTINDFELEITRQPLTSIDKAPPGGKVWIVGLAAADHVITRSKAFTRDVPVQIALQKLITAGSPAENEAELDRYEDLEDELRDTARLVEHERFAWLRNEPLRDENGTPFSYAGLRQHSTFEAYFTAYYKVGLR
jgi:hypothetical protein